MPPSAVKTYRDLICYEYVKLIAAAADSTPLTGTGIGDPGSLRIVLEREDDYSTSLYHGKDSGAVEVYADLFQTIHPPGER